MNDTSDSATNQPTTLDHDAIALLIPHSDSMCLLAGTVTTKVLVLP